MLRGADLILVMERSHREALGIDFPFTRSRSYLLTEVARGTVADIPDPFYNPRCTPQEVAADIRGLIREGFGAICARMGQPLAT
jgi:protein-tyrosine-phosphatase